MDAAADWTTCSSPKSISGLADGDHTFRVRAVDSDLNIDPSPATRSFSTDTTAPKTKIAKLPGKTKKRNVTVKFTASEAKSSFECKVDAKAYKKCRSPLRLKNLKLGKHTVQVRATDKLGNKGKSVKKTFKVVAK